MVTIFTKIPKVNQNFLPAAHSARVSKESVQNQLTGFCTAQSIKYKSFFGVFDIFRISFKAIIKIQGLVGKSDTSKKHRSCISKFLSFF